MLAALVALCALDLPILDHAFREWTKTPEMRIEDAYKWLYQATLGGEHAVSDDSRPRAWLEAEWATLGEPAWGEREVQRLDPAGRVLRVHLRPYRARGGDREMLLTVFVASARRFRADKSVFLSHWRELGRRLERRPWKGLNATAWARMDREAFRRGYPGTHHSQQYERTYRPAYRVVLGEMWTP